MRPSVSLATRITAGVAVAVACGIAPPRADAQLLPATIDADAATQCTHAISRADFSEPVALHRGDRREFRALRLQYETTARISEPRVFTLATNGAPLRYRIAQPQFFYFRPWATPPEFIGFAQLEIPADLPLGAIAVDAARGGCASNAVMVNELAAVPQMLAEISPTTLTPVFPAETASLKNRPVAVMPHAPRAPHLAESKQTPKPAPKSAARPPQTASSVVASRIKPTPTPIRVSAAQTAPTAPSIPSAQPPPSARSTVPVGTPTSRTSSVFTTSSPVPRNVPLGAATPCVQPDQDARVLKTAPVDARNKGKSINDRPTVGRVRVALNADGTVRKAEIAESSGFPLLDARMRESAVRSVYAAKVEACAPIASDYVARYEIGF